MPPAAHIAGRLAFAYTVVGYVAGLLEDPEETSVLTTILVVAGGSAAAVLLYAAVGGLLGDARVSRECRPSFAGCHRCLRCGPGAVRGPPRLRPRPPARAGRTAMTPAHNSLALTPHGSPDRKPFPVTDRSRLRLVVLGVLVISLVATLIGRLWYLQVLAAPQFRAQALDNQIRDIVTEAPRGEIVDDKGRPLVDNKTALVISVDRIDAASAARRRRGGAAPARQADPQAVPPAAQRDPALRHQTRTATSSSAPCWAGSPYQPIPVSQLKPGHRRRRGGRCRSRRCRRSSPASRRSSPRCGTTRSRTARWRARSSATSARSPPSSSKALPANQQDDRAQHHGRRDRPRAVLREVPAWHAGPEAGHRRPCRRGDRHGQEHPAAAGRRRRHQHRRQGAGDARAAAAGRDQHRAELAATPRTTRRASCSTPGPAAIVAMASDPTYNPASRRRRLTTKQLPRGCSNSQGTRSSTRRSAAPTRRGRRSSRSRRAGSDPDGTMSTGGCLRLPDVLPGPHNFDGESGTGLHLAARGAGRLLRHVLLQARLPGLESRQRT